MFELDNYCMNLVYEIETARDREWIDDRAVAHDSQRATRAGFQPLALVRSILTGVVALIPTMLLQKQGG